MGKKGQKKKKHNDSRCFLDEPVRSNADKI